MLALADEQNKTAWQQMPSVISYIFRFTTSLMAACVVATALEIYLTGLAEGGIAAARVATEDAERARRATVNNVSIGVGGGDYGKYIVWLASPEADAWRAGVVKELYVATKTTLIGEGARTIGACASGALCVQTTQAVSRFVLGDLLRNLLNTLRKSEVSR
jgi:hypothetical protein